MGGEWTPGDVADIVSNPFYAIELDPSLCVSHPLLVSEEQWIAANVQRAEQEGVEEVLRSILTVLKAGPRAR